MIDIAITRLSSKGQIVIPSEMRKNFNIGDKLVIIKNDEQLILKKASGFNNNLEDDLIFAKRTEDALKKYEKGLYKEMDDKSFTNEIEKW